MRKFLAALPLLLVAQLAYADSPPAWHKASFPGGSISVMTPCLESELDIKSTDNAYRLVCRKDGMMYLASQGMPADGDGVVKSYDEMLEGTRSNLADRLIDQTKFQGHRAFRIPCSSNWHGDSEKVPCIMLIDMAPAAPLIVAAMTENGPEGTGPEDVPVHAALAKQYYKSLELTGK